MQAEGGVFPIFSFVSTASLRGKDVAGSRASKIYSHIPDSPMLTRLQLLQKLAWPTLSNKMLTTIGEGHSILAARSVRLTYLRYDAGIIFIFLASRLCGAGLAWSDAPT